MSPARVQRVRDVRASRCPYVSFRDHRGERRDRRRHPPVRARASAATGWTRGDSDVSCFFSTERARSTGSRRRDRGSAPCAVSGLALPADAAASRPRPRRTHRPAESFAPASRWCAVKETHRRACRGRSRRHLQRDHDRATAEHDERQHDQPDLRPRRRRAGVGVRRAGLGLRARRLRRCLPASLAARTIARRCSPSAPPARSRPPAPASSCARGWASRSRPSPRPSASLASTFRSVLRYRACSCPSPPCQRRRTSRPAHRRRCRRARVGRLHRSRPTRRPLCFRALRALQYATTLPSRTPTTRARSAIDGLAATHRARRGARGSASTAGLATVLRDQLVDVMHEVIAPRDDRAQLRRRQQRAEAGLVARRHHRVERRVVERAHPRDQAPREHLDAMQRDQVGLVSEREHRERQRVVHEEQRLVIHRRLRVRARPSIGVVDQDVEHDAIVELRVQAAQLVGNRHAGVQIRLPDRLAAIVVDADAADRGIADLGNPPRHDAADVAVARDRLVGDAGLRVSSRAAGSAAAMIHASTVKRAALAGGTWPMPSQRSMRYAAISRRGSDCGWVCSGLNAARAPDAKSSRSDSDVPPWLSLTRVTADAASGASSTSSGAS